MTNLNNKTLHATSAAVSSGSKEFEEFIYLLSHDLRNAVRSIVELPQWIEEDLEAEGQLTSKSVIENFALMHTQTRRLDGMLNDLLTFSRVGRMQEVCIVDLNKAVAEVLETIDVPVGFTIGRDFHCPTLRIGNRDIQTLFLALISNSIKHHDQDSGVIRITSRQVHSECVITVTDDGPGIAEKKLERVFDVMTTLKSRDEVEGSGMGLAIVRKIVNLNGGQLKWVMLPSGRGISLEIRFQV